jgi:hypothetical protein
MMTPARTLPAAVSLALFVAAAPARADNAAIPYGKLEAFQSAFNAIPAAQRNKLILEVAIVHSDEKDHSPIKAWVDAGGKHIDIPAAEDGALQLPDRSDWVSQDVLVQTDQPKHTLGIGIDVVATPLPGSTFPVKLLLDAVQQGNDAMRAGARSMGGFLARLAAPASKTVNIDLVTCCGGTATVTGGAGSTVLKQAPSGTVAIPFETLKASADGSVALSAAPKRIGLFGD